jgi:hypothetical protein
MCAAADQWLAIFSIHCDVRSRRLRSPHSRRDALLTAVAPVRRTVMLSTRYSIRYPPRVPASLTAHHLWPAEHHHNDEDHLGAYCREESDVDPAARMGRPPRQPTHPHQGALHDHDPNQSPRPAALSRAQRPIPLRLPRNRMARRHSKAIGQPSATTMKSRMTITSHSMPHSPPATRP